MPIDLALGTVDALEWSSSSRGSLRVLHHALNNDLMLAPVGGEDAKLSFQRYTLVGAARTYAYVGKQFTASAWLRAIKEARTFFSTGPLVEFTVNQEIPGGSVHLPLAVGTVTLEDRVWSWMPLTRMIVYHDDEVLKEIPLAGALTGEFRETITVDKSGWFSLVAEGPGAGRGEDSSFLQAVTGAIRVYVGQQKIRSRESAEYFIKWIEKLRGFADKWPAWRAEAERRRVYTQFDEASAIYEELATEAAGSGPAQCDRSSRALIP